MLREVRELFSYHSKSTTRFAEHDVHNVYRKSLRDLKRCGFDGMSGKRVLDLGCGQRYPFALQCAADGAEVSALDTNYVRPDFLPTAFFRTVKHNGVKRAAKSALRRLLWDGRYFRALAAGSGGASLRSYQSQIEFVVADPTSARYPLESNAFDLIVSNAVLEHVADVPGFAKEVSRLLDSDGYFWARIHNFYSLSGGHSMEWAFPDENPSRKVPPWDHLRENRFPTWTYLNRWRPEEYEREFAKHLRVLLFEGVGINHDVGELEGERFLTDEIARELKEYSRELLLSRAWLMICRKS